MWASGREVEGYRGGGIGGGTNAAQLEDVPELGLQVTSMRLPRQ